MLSVRHNITALGFFSTLFSDVNWSEILYGCFGGIQVLDK